MSFVKKKDKKKKQENKSEIDGRKHKNKIYGRGEVYDEINEKLVVPPVPPRQPRSQAKQKRKSTQFTVAGDLRQDYENVTVLVLPASLQSIETLSDGEISDSGSLSPPPAPPRSPRLSHHRRPPVPTPRSRNNTATGSTGDTDCDRNVQDAMLSYATLEKSGKQSKNKGAAKQTAECPVWKGTEMEMPVADISDQSQPPPQKPAMLQIFIPLDQATGAPLGYGLEFSKILKSISFDLESLTLALKLYFSQN